MELQYNERFDYFNVGSDFQTLDVRLANKDSVQKYMNGKHTELFANFEPQSDSVEIVEIGSEVYFIHVRSKERLSEEKFGPTNDKNNQLPSGIYKFDYVANEGLVIKPIRNLSFDDYIELSNTEKTIGDDIEKFLDSENVFNKYGFNYSRGSLAYGPQGTGKTMTIMNAVSNLTEKRDNTVAFVLTSNAPRYFDELRDYKKVLEGNQKFVFIIEEITEQTEDFESILSFLDGEQSWSGSYNIATTNYPNRIPENVIDRPGRFDQHYEFNNPTEDDRRKYLQSLNVNVDENLLELTKGFSLAHLKEIVLSSDLHDMELEERIEELNELKKKIKNEFGETETLDEDKVDKITKTR